MYKIDIFSPGKLFVQINGKNEGSAARNGKIKGTAQRRQGEASTRNDGFV